MKINKTHRIWFVMTIGLLLLSTAFYIHYVKTSPNGPTGGSWQGMVFGILGTAMMIYAGVFPSRKKRPNLKVGSGSFWLKGHIWLGLLSAPLILFHSGFRFGGGLEQALMIVFAIVIVSGVYGLVLQNYVPRLMRENIAAESMYEQVPHICKQLRRNADEQVKTALDAPLIQAPTEGEHDKIALRDFYINRVRPYLSPDDSDALESQGDASAVFAQVRTMLPPRFYATLDNLMEICEERRALGRQMRMHGWLHSWLLIHVPLSMTLLVLGIVHVAMSLWY